MPGRINYQLGNCMNVKPINRGTNQLVLPGMSELERSQEYKILLRLERGRRPHQGSCRTADLLTRYHVAVLEFFAISS